MKKPNPSVTVKTTVPKTPPIQKVATTPKIATGGGKFGAKFKRLAPRMTSRKMRMKSPSSGGGKVKSFSNQFDPSSNVK